MATSSIFTNIEITLTFPYFSLSNLRIIGITGSTAGLLVSAGTLKALRRIGSKHKVDSVLSLLGCQ